KDHLIVFRHIIEILQKFTLELHLLGILLLFELSNLFLQLLILFQQLLQVEFTTLANKLGDVARILQNRVHQRVLSIVLRKALLQVGLDRLARAFQLFNLLASNRILLDLLRHIAKVKRIIRIVKQLRLWVEIVDDISAATVTS